MSEIRRVQYVASPTAELFHNSPAVVRGLMGPVGGGKSVANCFELWNIGMQQEPDKQGIRPTRMLVARNTFPELKTTTIKTWLDWFPAGKDGVGELKWGSPIVHQVRFPLPDGTLMEMDVEFLALDDEKDVKKLLSYECTAVWFNEAREIKRELVDGATMRIGRYPSAKRVPCTRKAVIMDTNPPPDTHWWFELAEMETPEGYGFWTQPSGLDEKAENLENLNQGEWRRLFPDKGYDELTLEERRKVGRLYYLDMMRGKDQDWINVYVHARYGFLRQGQPVFDNVWNPALHVAKDPIKIRPGGEIYIGVDASGRHPAAVFAQRDAFGQWQIVHELCIVRDEGMSATNFAELLTSEIKLKFADNFIVNPLWGDPAGDHPGINDDRSYFDILNAALKKHGLRAKASPGRLIPQRLETVHNCLGRLIDGKPALVVSPTCKHLIQGFNGGYQFKQIASTGENRFHEKPHKNRFSDVQDALQYLLCGVGEMRTMLGQGRGSKKPHIMAGDWSPFG